MAETFAERKRRERLEKIKEARKRQTRRLIIAGIAAAVVIALVIFLLNSPYLKIKEVRVTKTAHLSEGEIRKVEKMLSGKNIVFAPVGDARDSLLKNPWLKEVAFHKRYPSKIEVVVKERVPVAQIAYQGKFYLVSEDGMVLDTLFEPADIIQIADLEVKDVKPGKVIKSKPFNDAISVYRSLPADLKKKVLVISAPVSEKIIFYIGGIEVVYGAPDYADEKNQILQEILKREGSKAIYIDLRVPNSPVVKTKP